MITKKFIIDQYTSGVENYTKSTLEIGLWDSEKYVFTKYLRKTAIILDLGCGTGRTTFHLYKSGFTSILGIDLTPAMIEQAKLLNTHFHSSIKFNVGDARNLEFEDEYFDSVIFSFNGLMGIPSSRDREKAVAEIYRVLTNGGIFIFTTHDREIDEEYLEFWKEEKIKWDLDKQNPELTEFGDLISKSKNDSREIFIHIPDQKEIQELLTKAGFKILETFFRSEKFQENEAVKKVSGECRFWIAGK